MRAGAPKKGKSSQDEHVFVTCEVKRKNERLLEDQIRFQVHQGFRETAKLKDPTVEAVKPIAIRIVAAPGGGSEKLMYLVEFKSVKRTDYEDNWKPVPATRKPKKPEDDTAVYGMPLELASDAFFRVRPAVKGVS